LRQQADRGGEQWDSLTLPALAGPDDPLGRQPGDALWPDRYPKTALEDIKASIAAHWWSALYQQRPVPPGGALAKAIWFAPAPPLTGRVTRCRFWDCGGGARTPGRDPDPTVGALMARKGDQYVVEDIIRTQSSSGDVMTLMVQTAKRDGPDVWIREEQEPGSAGKAVVNSRKIALAGFNYQGIPSTHAKTLRWQPLLTQAELGHVGCVTGAWTSGFLSEVADAPYGAHDDQLDAAAGAYAVLAFGGKLSATDVLGIGLGDDWKETRKQF
jgi:predicted phage terminase large subunit-like protein